MFTKLANYIVRSPTPCSGEHAVTDHATQGKNLVHLIDRPDEPHCFRLQKDRVFYVSESSMRLAISVARPNLISLGTCFGKFTKSGKFKLHITALDYLAQYAKYKVRCMQIWLCGHAELMRQCRCGSNRTGRCPSCTATTSSKRTLVASLRTRLSTKEWLYTA